ncbi:hypothetical protein Tco_1159405, partial [Tanacetum coccineum]
SSNVRDNGSRSFLIVHGASRLIWAAAPGNGIQPGGCSKSRAAAPLVSAFTFLNSSFKLPD